MDADIGVRVRNHLTDARTGTRCRWYTRLAAECICPPAQARCPPLGAADDHVAADWLDVDGASTFAEGARLRRYSRSNRGRCARQRLASSDMPDAGVALEGTALPTWVGVGGSPQSVIRAARYGLPLMLAIIGGHPSRFAPYVELYKRALKEYGRPTPPIGMHSPGFVANTDEEALESSGRIGRTRSAAASAERG